VPKANFLENYIRNHPSFTNQSLPSFHVHEYSPLLDSSDVNAKHWLQLAHNVERHYADYDGFVILHGTDTLAYTATALSFALCNLAKPVIITGAQIPIQEAINDAVQNLAGALFIGLCSLLSLSLELYLSLSLELSRTLSLELSRTLFLSRTLSLSLALSLSLSLELSRTF
jgi:Asparaginase, N-terminal